jgi:hypothetical protein
MIGSGIMLAHFPLSVSYRFVCEPGWGSERLLKNWRILKMIYSCNKVKLRIVVIMYFISAGLCFADSDRVYNPSNGHSYQRFDLSGANEWDIYKEYCESLDGYLATITSREEQEFVYENVGYDSFYAHLFIGATDKIYEGDWRWVTGEPWDYENWCPGQPFASNYRLEMNRDGGCWKGTTDVPGGSGICEWSNEGSGEPTITLDAPQNPITVNPQDNVTIRWSTTGALESDRIIISMKRDAVDAVETVPDDQNWYRFTSHGASSNDDGYEIVTIPTGLIEASDWRIYVGINNESEVWDSSSTFFYQNSGSIDPVSKPQISVKGGFIKLDTIGGMLPSNDDCSSSDHYGRQVYDEIYGRLYICSQSGWLAH